MIAQLQEMISKHGKDQQLLLVFEELAELIIAVTKFERGVVSDTKNIIEEIADVRIVSEYCKLFYDITEEDIEVAIQNKLERLKTYKVLKNKT